MVNSIWLNSGKRGATENPLFRPREGSESRASEPPPPERGGHGLGSAMVQGSEGRGHANQDDRWTRRRDKSAAPARHSRSQDTTGARPPPSPWPAVGRWPRRKREGSRGAERRWRGDQDQVDSRRENVCACSSAVGEYATSKFSNFSEKGQLTFCFASFFSARAHPE